MLLRPICFRALRAKQVCGGINLRCGRPTSNALPRFPANSCGPVVRFSFPFSHRSCSSSSSAPPKVDPEPPKADPITPVLPVNVVTNEYVQKYLFIAGNLGYVILASGMLMTDILFLRCLLASGYLSLVCYHIFQLRPLRIPLCGSAFFVFVNIYFAVKIYLSRQVALSDTERAIYDKHFKHQGMLDYEFEKLIRAADIITAHESTQIVQMGKTQDNMFFVLEGELDVCLADETHIRLPPNNFVGEHSFIQRTSGSMKANANVDALPGCTFIRWNLAELSSVLDKFPQATRALESMVGRDLAQKLVRSNDRLARTEHRLLALRCVFINHSENNVMGKLRTAFKKFDKDGGYSLTFDEFEPMISEISEDVTMTKEQKYRIFSSVDVNKDGEIDVNEFLEWMLPGKVAPRSKTTAGI